MRQIDPRHSLLILFCFLLPSCGYAESYTLIQGKAAVYSGADIYAFREEQIDSMLAKEIVNGKLPNASVFFSKLPFSKAVAHTKSGPNNSQFSLLLPEHGNFVIASNAKDYLGFGSNVSYTGQQFFWLIRVRTNGKNKLKVELDHRNTVDTSSPGIIQLDVKDR